MSETNGEGKGKKRPGGGLSILFLQLVNIGVLAVIFALSIDWWGKLPERIPVHFGLDGQPDRWAGPGLWNWFALPLVGVGMTVFFFAILAFRGISERHPWIVSLPRKNTFLKLDPDARKRVLTATFCRITLFPLPAYLYILFGQWAGFEVAMGRMHILPWWSVAVFLGTAVVMLVYYIFSLDGLIRKEARKAGLIS